MADCWNCAYREELPGSYHIQCVRRFGKVSLPELNPHGVRNGWCFFPVNFDPIWVGNCKGFARKSNPKNVETDKSRGFLTLAALLARRINNG